MSDGITGQIGDEGQMPLLVIVDESDEPVAALIVVEEPEPTVPLPAPAVEAIVTRSEIKVVAPEPEAQLAAAAPSPEPDEDVPVPARAPDAAPMPLPVRDIESAAPMPAAKPRRTIHPLVPLTAVSLAVFASSISVIGLLVASRTVAETRIVLEQVQAHQAKMRHLDTVIDELDALRRREQIALMRIEQINAGKPATGAEVRGAIANLQMAMAKYQPGGSNGTMTLLRDGQSELAERVSTIYRRVEMMNEKMDKLVVGKSRLPAER